MAKVKSNNSDKKLRPALTPEAEENQLISLAMDLVKQRLIDGTASSQETTHFLRLGSSDSRLKKELMETQNELMQAKKEQIQSQKKIEDLYLNAVKAMKDYSGHGDVDEY